METMTPAEVGAWLRAHGGPAGGSGPDANGVIVQRAADGSTITTRGTGSTLEVVDTQEAAPGDAADVPSAGASPAAPTEPTGTGMSQRQLEAMLAQMGTLGSGDFREETKQEDIPNPAAMSEGVPVLGVAPTIKGPVTYRTWVKPGTNQRLTVKVNPDGTYTQTFFGADPGINPTKPSEQTATAKPPEQKDEGGRRLIWQANPGGPNAGGKWVDVGTAPETPAERAAREAQAPTQTVTRETGGDGKPYTVITIVPKPGQPGQPGQIVLGPDGQPAPGGIPGKPPVEKREPVERVVNGVKKTYIQVTKQNPDGSSELYFTDQAGTRVALPDETKPSGYSTKVPAFRPDIAKPGAGIVERSQELAAAVARGDITPNEADAIIAADHATATAVAADAHNRAQAAAQEYATSVSQRGQDITQAGNRLSAAGSAFSTALQNAQSTLPSLAEHSANAPGLVLGNLLLGGITANAYGGMQPTPAVAPAGALLSYTGAVPASARAAGAGAATPVIGPANAAPSPAVVGPVPAGAAAVSPPVRDDWRTNPAQAPVASAPPASAAPPVSAPAAPAAPQWITIRHKGTGTVSRVSAGQWPFMTNRDEFDVIDQGAAGDQGAAPTGLVPASVGTAALAGGFPGVTHDDLDAWGIPSQEQLDMLRRQRIGGVAA